MNIWVGNLVTTILPTNFYLCKFVLPTNFVLAKDFFL